MEYSIKLATILLCSSFAFFSCNTDKTAPETNEVSTEMDVEVEQDNTEVDKELLEVAIGFMGVAPGQEIEGNSILTKGELKNGEGSFTTYYINDTDGNAAGYAMEDPNQAGIVGDVYVTKSGASVTGAKGIKVGDNWKQLRNIYPDIEVHGSEIESRTYATTTDLRFRLDAVNNQYDLKQTDVMDDVKIIEIVINRK